MEIYVTKYAPQKALKLIARGELTFDGRFLVQRMISPVCGHLTFTYLKACWGVVGMEGSGSQMFGKERALLAKVKRSS